MGHSNELLEVDIYVDPRPITKEDRVAFSEYIKAEKLKLPKNGSLSKKRGNVKRAGKLKTV
jgi:hypothetical protein